MNSIKLKLDSIDKVKTFVNTISFYDGDFDLVSKRYIVDAKSIMGIFSLDLSNELELVVHNEDYVEEVKEKLSDYLV
ncbi:MAG: HPr family phosphocarrier protein [Lachnospirales bacterium]